MQSSCSLFEKERDRGMQRGGKNLLAPTPGRRAAFALALIFGMGCTSAPAAEWVEKAPGVVDAGTLSFANTAIHLAGVVAPKMPFLCQAGSLLWACGREARWALVHRIAGHWVHCQSADASPATVTPAASCRLAGRTGPELNLWLVTEGWALAAPDDGEAYREAEKAAREANLGIWRGGFAADINLLSAQ